MSNPNLQLATLMIAAGIVLQAQAAIDFTLAYSDPSGNTASGLITANDNLNGTFSAISGTLDIITSTTLSAVGSYVLVPGGPGITLSPNGAFNFDDLITYPGDPYLDVYGLLFSGAGNREVNLWGNGPGNYSLYLWEPGLSYTLQYTGPATTELTPVPEPAPIVAVALLLLPMGARALRQWPKGTRRSG